MAECVCSRQLTVTFKPSWASCKNSCWRRLGDPGRQALLFNDRTFSPAWKKLEATLPSTLRFPALSLWIWDTWQGRYCSQHSPSPTRCFFTGKRHAISTSHFRQTFWLIILSTKNNGSITARATPTWLLPFVAGWDRAKSIKVRCQEPFKLGWLAHSYSWFSFLSSLQKAF